ncbi:MAG TPA: ABC transporter permease, partial [Anaerolineae bacterium]|nr:ABC transporter permease [Anaerolineae bacterium]
MATRTTVTTADSMLDVERTLRDRLAYAGRFLWRDRSGVIGMLMFLTVVFAAVFAPLIAPYDPLEQNLRDAKMPPAWYEEGSWEHPLGTDNLGRDLFSRVIYGARVSL